MRRIPGSLVKVRLVGTKASDNRLIGNMVFNDAIPLAEADALLAFCGASEELLTFGGPKAWYAEEPLSMSHYRTPLAKRLLKSLDSSEFLHHSNAPGRYCVPSPTHLGSLAPIIRAKVADRIVAVVRNYGGRLWWLRKGPRIRNRFILNPLVDLYGPHEAWEHFRGWPLARPKVPANYCGKLNTNWYDDAYIEFLAGFKVCVCLENSLGLENYFTEKFVNAVRAGCIPIYHAHASVRRDRLQGAKWVDPTEHGFNPFRTLKFALSQEAAEYRAANDLWLKTPQVVNTHRDYIWKMIARILAEKLSIPVPD